MSLDRIKLSMAAVLGVLAEIPQGGPASHLYLALGGDIEHWNQVNRIGAGLWTCSDAHWVQATPKGLDLGKQVNAATAGQIGGGQ